MTGRSQELDAFRGIVIVDMMVMHFAGDQTILGFPMQMVDFAVEGFLFLAGFTIGWHSLPKFRQNKWAAASALWGRAGKIVLIHYLMTLTISLPFWSYFYLQTAEEVVDFGLSSVLFLNQIPILHILPTFIPLFLLSPAFLYLLSRNWDWWLPVGSLALFGIFVSDPNALSIGDSRIFPVILWQVYFVFGCFLGKRVSEEGILTSNALLMLACVLFGLCLILKYGGNFSTIHEWKEKYNLYPKKFPLNALGLVYGSAFLAFVYSVFRFASTRVQSGNPAFAVLSLIGRQSLLVFFLHAYVVFAVKALTLLGATPVLVLATTVISLWMVFSLAKLIDRKGAEKNLPGYYKWLFS